MFNIIFDLDGTIWNASNSTAIAWSKVFKKWGYCYNITSENIMSVAGKPYMECLLTLVPDVVESDSFDRILQDLAIEEKNSMMEFSGEYYPEVIETINKLSIEHNIFLVSNCNDWYLESFLDNSGTRKIFIEAVCFDTFGKNKVFNLEYLIKKYNIEKAFYIGDTLGDKNSAEAVGLTYIHHEKGFDKDLRTSYSFCEYATLYNLLREIK